MTRLNRILASAALALGLLGYAQSAQAQYSRTTSTSWSSSFGYSSSWSSGPNGFQSSRSGYSDNSFQRTNTYSNPYGTFGRTYSSNNYRDWNVNQGFNNGTYFQNRGGNQFSNGRIDTFSRYR